MTRHDSYTVAPAAELHCTLLFEDVTRRLIVFFILSGPGNQSSGTFGFNGVPHGSIVEPLILILIGYDLAVCAEDNLLYISMFSKAIELEVV